MRLDESPQCLFKYLRRIHAMAHQLVWFRTDLRVRDNAALTAACERAIAAGGHVLPVYVIDPRFYGTTRFGFAKTGAFRRRFLEQCVQDLRKNLLQRGAHLRVVAGQPEDVLPQLAADHNIAAAHFQAAVATEERNIEQAVIRRLEDRRVLCSVTEPATLYSAEDLPFAMDELPEVFTQFRRQVEKRCDIRPPLPPPDHIPGPADVGQMGTASDINAADSGDATSDEVLARMLQTQITDDPRSTMTFVGGETAAWNRIADWVWDRDLLRTYKETRNGMLREADSSRLAPWLAQGCVSPRSVFAEVERYEQQRVANDSTYWLVFELLWRDYFAFIVRKHGAAVFRRGGLRGLELPWSTDQARFDAWREGRTGYPIIDACMRELAATGFLSNRGRQNVASFLTKNLGIDWRMGAEWFESLLLDYDPCSNYGNWNYTAGVGNDARGFRWFNTTKQARDYDRRGDFVRHWLPELRDVPGDHIHEPWNMHPARQQRSGCRIGEDYPSPIVDLFASANANERLYQNVTKEVPRPRRRRRR